MTDPTDEVSDEVADYGEYQLFKKRNGFVIAPPLPSEHLNDLFGELQ